MPVSCSSRHSRTWATAPVAAPTMTNPFYSHQAAGTMGIFDHASAAQNESFSIGAGRNWGTIVFELAHS